MRDQGDGVPVGGSRGRLLGPVGEPAGPGPDLTGLWLPPGVDPRQVAAAAGRPAADPPSAGDDAAGPAGRLTVGARSRPAHGVRPHEALAAEALPAESLGTRSHDGGSADAPSAADAGADTDAGAGVRGHLFAGLSSCSAAARTAVDALISLAADPPGADAAPGAGAVLADDLVLLARAAHLLEAATGRLAAAADRRDATATGVRPALKAAGWTPGRAAVLLDAARLAHTHPRLWPLWQTGHTTAPQLAAIAAGTEPLTPQQRSGIVDALEPLLPLLGVSGARRAVDAAVDALTPEPARQREQFAYDRRRLLVSRLRDEILIDLRLPALEGEAFLAAVAAHADKLRADGDRLTPSQRSADGVIALVAAAAAAGTTPTRGGLPAAATITIPLHHADRLTGHPHTTNCTSGGGAQLPLPVPAGGAIGTRHTLADAAARFLLCHTDLTPVLVTHPPGATPLAALLGAARTEPLAVGRAQRLATSAQRKALAVRDKGCVIPGCGADPAHCQPHHTTDWAHGGTTDLDTLALLCWPHHRQVDLHRWRLTRNPHPHGPHWTITPTHRHTWTPRTE